MIETLYNEFSRALQEGRSYLPVRLASLREGSVTGFNLFIQAGPDRPMTLYCEANVPFTEARRQRLIENNIETLYISAEDEGGYRQYLEDNLSLLLSDDTVATGEKSRLLYVSAHGLVRDVLEAPRHPEAVRRSREMAQTTIDFLFQDNTAFEFLLKIGADNYYTPTHSVHVCVYGIMIAHRAGLDNPEALRDFGNGLLLHDVGKSQISSQILNSSAPLTRRQWETLKKHPEIGHQLVNRVGGLGPIGLDVVRHHHERLSGNGYPDRFSARQITPYVRIATIADVFDALTTNRPFRPAFSTFDALKLMRGEMAQDLDQEFLRVFIELMGNPRG